MTGLADRVVWDTSKPDGQDYRAYDLSTLFATRFPTTGHAGGRIAPDL